MKKLSENKKVSIVVACRNEAGFIKDCLDSIINQDYPNKLMEIFVIDGMSDDGTRDILKDFEKKYSNIKVLDNKKMIQPHAFNMGIRASSGEYIFIMGAHNVYLSNYVSDCVRYALKYKTDNVGGRIEAKTKDSSFIAQAIIGAYTSSFGIGNATFRKKTTMPVYVDTVFGGCYKRGVFEKIGYYNESLRRSQDVELNLRLKRAGGKILMVPSIVSYYYPKTELISFIRYNYMAGKGPIRAIRITGNLLKPMHYVPALFVSGLLFGLVTFFVDSLNFFSWVYLAILFIYLGLSLLSSLVYAIKSKRFALFIVLPFIFFAKHLFYGLGSIFGLFRIED
ncbi:MAG: glycosyltransferase family 2 protein [Patescibacteria group bacterium]|nr:glycosyltransferase family 2 protein [Patescibacteria group bacterium]